MVEHGPEEGVAARARLTARVELSDGRLRFESRGRKRGEILGDEGKVATTRLRSGVRAVQSAVIVVAVCGTRVRAAIRKHKSSVKKIRSESTHFNKDVTICIRALI